MNDGFEKQKIIQRQSPLNTSLSKDLPVIKVNVTCFLYILYGPFYIHLHSLTLSCLKT